VPALVETSLTLGTGYAGKGGSVSDAVAQTRNGGQGLDRLTVEPFTADFVNVPVILAAALPCSRAVGLRRRRSPRGNRAGQPSLDRGAG
jgi:hypothetical protein